MADIDFEEVQLGTAPTGVGGDVPRTAFGKITRNFNKIKAFFADSSNAASRKVGTGAGDVMEVGAGGLLGRGRSLSSMGELPTKNEFTRGNGPNTSDGVGQDNFFPSLDLLRGSENSVRLSFGLSGRSFVRTFFDGNMTVVENLNTGNTTTDSNGFIKEASPIIKLFNDKIEKTDHLEIQSAALEKLGTGHYKIAGVPELSRDGWYIETPKDRNNNIYFTLDYEENNGELIIKTYEPDYSSGRAENGEPVDILEDRFVSLRFAENPELYPEPKDEQE